VVVVRGVRLGKPADRTEAISMLRRLHGRTHEVWTGIAVVRDGDRRTAAECTRVQLARLGENEIEAYVRTREPLDKGRRLRHPGNRGAVRAAHRGRLHQRRGASARAAATGAARLRVSAEDRE
jgi:septum formation protein